MQFPELIEGRLIKRYKRFLADIKLLTGEVITAHCPNTGSMKNCGAPGSRVWLWDSKNPKRKLQHTWELVEVSQSFLACINTHRANGLVKEAIEEARIPELMGYPTRLSEQKYGKEGSRIDLLLKGGGLPDCYVEVKNVTQLVEDGLGTFPDAVTTRGTKHLRELIDVVASGQRAVLFYNVAHTGIQRVSPAESIDPHYCETLTDAISKGVEVLAYSTHITLDNIVLNRRIDFSF